MGCDGTSDGMSASGDKEDLDMGMGGGNGSWAAGPSATGPSATGPSR
jgi:hypothetical protein